MIHVIGSDLSLSHVHKTGVSCSIQNCLIIPFTFLSSPSQTCLPLCSFAEVAWLLWALCVCGPYQGGNRTAWVRPLWRPACCFWDSPWRTLSCCQAAPPFSMRDVETKYLHKELLECRAVVTVRCSKPCWNNSQRCFDSSENLSRVPLMWLWMAFC